LVDRERPARVVDPEEPARDDRARAGGGIFPLSCKAATREYVPGGTRTIGDEEPRAPGVSPDGGRREETLAAGGRNRLQLAAGRRSRRTIVAVQLREAEHAEDTVLAALHGEPVSEERGRGAAEVGVAAVEVRLIGRCPVLEEPGGVGREEQHAVAPGAHAVEESVSRGDEQVAGGRIDHHARARPDGGARLGA